MNELMISVGVGLVSATWQWFWRRSASQQEALAQSWRAADTGLRRLRVTRVVNETAGAATLHLEPEGGGPRPMMDAARTGLQARGGPAGSIAEERFTAAGPVEGASGDSHEVTFRTREGERTVRVAGKTLLQAAREARLPLDSLCERGVCGTCKVRVCSGAVDAGPALALDERERAGGHVLACVARPTGAAVVDLEPAGSSLR